MNNIYTQIVVCFLCVAIGALLNRNKLEGKIQKYVFIVLISMNLISLFINDEMFVAYIRIIFSGLAVGWALTGKWGSRNKQGTH